MASRALTVLARRAAVAKRAYHTSAVTMGGATPPLPPFARIPKRTENMPENADCVWDDGVAPELALDFDMPNVSTGEAILTWAGALGSLLSIVYFLKVTVDPENMPVVMPKVFVVDKDWADHKAVPIEKEE